jgi:oligoribonuclease
MNMFHQDNLIWIDLEMTGLLPDQNRIIEIATIVTDSQLNIIAEGPVLAIKQPAHFLEAMDEWNQTQHGGSGLLARVKNSAVTDAIAEQATIDFLKQYVPAGKSPMCGNSICLDRRFLSLYMPNLEAYFHYRHIDVSTLKELVRRWMPDVGKGFNKTSEHLALSDIKDSIEELAYYRKHCFREL